MNTKWTLKYSKENQSTNQQENWKADQLSQEVRTPSLLGELRKLYSENWNNINNQVKRNFLNFLYCRKYNIIDIIYVHFKASRTLILLPPLLISL